MKLHIADGLDLPENAVTQKFAFLGRTGSGKSYGATKLAELMLERKAQVIALDPVGVWWGLRTGKLDVGPRGGGFEIYVFGGLHGDLPLEPGAGALIADLIVDRNISAVLDVSQMLAGQQARFATDFVTQLFQRKKAAPAPLHLFIEEAQEFVPQNVGKSETHMVHAFERLIKLGRNFGIGASLISQRPQEVNKKALNQTECLFAFQMTGPQERKAIESWVAEKGADLDIVQLLPKLQVGSPHVWSPQWLGVSKTVRIAEKITDDVSATPTFSKGAKAAPVLAKVDLEDLRKQMAATIERAEEEDPRQLHKRIADLHKRNGELQTKLDQPAAPALDPKRLAMLEALILRLEGIQSMRDGLLGDILKTVQRLHEDVTPVKYANAPRDLHKPAATPKPVPIEAPRPMPKTPPRTDGEAPTGGLRRMMIALAQRPGLSAKQIGVRATMSSGSGTFSTYLGKMRSRGWAEGSRERMDLTPAGLAALGSYEPLPTGIALLDYWQKELPGGAARMLAELAKHYPKALTKQELGEWADISPGSGTFSTYLGKLRTLELVTGSRELKASEEFFQ